MKIFTTSSPRAKTVAMVSVLVMLSVLFILPMVSGGILFGDDTAFHLSRFQNMVSEMQNGNLKSFVYPSMYAQAGYAVGTFYPDLFLLPFAGLCLCGLSYQMAFGCYLFAVKAFTALAWFFSFRYIYRDRGRSNPDCWAFLISFVMFFDFYGIMNYYVRGALGEFTAAAFIPLIILGVYQIFYHNKWMTLAFAMTGMIYSHLITAMTVSLLLVGWYVLARPIKFYIKNPKVLLQTGKAALLCVALSAAFFIPAIEMIGSTDLVIKTGMTMLGSAAEHTSFETGLGSYTAIGYILLGLLILGLIFLKKPLERFALLFVGEMFVVSDLFPWNSGFFFEKLGGIIQFPWRMIGLMSAISAVLLFQVLSQKKINKNKTMKYGMIGGYVLRWVVLMTVMTFTIGAINTQVRYSEEDIQSMDDVGFMEYAPLSSAVRAHEHAKKNKEGGITSDELIYGYDVQDLNESSSGLGDYIYQMPRSEKEKTNVWIYKSKNNEKRDIVLPKFYYPGYEIIDNGEKMDYSKNEDGLILVSLPAGEHELSVRYIGTPAQKGAILISFMSLLAAVVFSARIKRAKQKE